MTKRVFEYENPNNGKTFTIDLAQIDDLAFEDGLDIPAEDMDDDTFYTYCARLLGE